MEIDVLVEDDGWSAVPDALAIAERAARAALASLGEEVPAEAEMSITLTDDARIRILNRDWRDKDKATNVLSFPAPELPEGVAPQPLGDVIVARETVLAEAAAEDKRPEDHLAHLVVHGTLHLMGFDHEDDDEAEEMEAAERAILAGLGINDPYALPLEG
nr:rRNA maturation RNase YbeY [Azorhizobium doebereinerae]